MKQEIIRLDRITQILDGVTLLDNLNLHIFKSEIFGLLCINNNGKEALIQLICQNTSIDYGNVYFMDSLVNSYRHSPKTANKILVIEKPDSLVEDLTVIDNIFMMAKRNEKQQVANLESYIEELGIDISPTALIMDLSFCERCTVLLLKAYIMGTKLVILRDLGNFLSTTDLKKIHMLLKKMLDKNMTFLYICNHHEEASRICDKIAFMENGRVIKILDKGNFDKQIAKFYSLNLQHSVEKDSEVTGDPEVILKFADVCTGNLKKLSFDVHRGECVTFLDINDTAIDDMISLLDFSADPIDGEIESWAGNIEIIAENPTQSMLFDDMSYIDNFCFLADKKLKAIWSGTKVKNNIIAEYRSLLGEDMLATDLYGLNMYSLYNLIYYRIHLLNPGVAVCVQPFSYADIYIRNHIIRLIGKLLEKKVAVIILTTNISDIVNISSRLFVLESGELKEELNRSEFDGGLWLREGSI